MLNEQAGLNELRQRVLLETMFYLIIVLFFIVLFDIFRYLRADKLATPTVEAIQVP